VSILKMLADVRVEEELPTTLECEFSRQNVDVKWLKVKRTDDRCHCSSVFGEWQNVTAACFFFFNTSVPLPPPRESERDGAEAGEELSDLLHGTQALLSDHAGLPGRLWHLHV